VPTLQGAEPKRRRRWRTGQSSLVAFVMAALASTWALKDFAAYGRDRPRKRNPAPYGRIGGKPIIPNPEAEKFPAGVPRDEDGFPVITLREQYETNVTMYNEGLGPFPGPPMDFSGDWDFIVADPEDPDFDPDAPMPPVPVDPPEELMALQPEGSIVWPDITADEPIPDSLAARAGRKVAAAPEPVEAGAPVVAGAAAVKELPPGFEDLRVPQLKVLLQERDLPVTGTKATLVQRLKDSAR